MRTEKGPALSRRLEAVKTAAGSCDVFADIGSDHALLPVKMVAEGLCRKAIVTDLRKGPLEKASENIERYCPDRTDRFDLRLGNGLSVLKKGEADVKAICGMGGLLIGDIIKNNFEIASEGKLILQPNTSVPELRTFLRKNGFEIEKEKCLCEDGHPYAVMTCRYAANVRTAEISDINAITGEFAGRDGDPDGIPYLKAVRKKYEAALCKINGDPEKGSGFEGMDARKAELQTIIGMINDILGENK